MLSRPDLLIPLIVFCIVTLFTPGPNNVMLMTSGLNYGMRRTLPAMFGVEFGFGFLVLCVGLGLGAIFTAYPLIYIILKYVGAAYLLYLAYVIATSDPAAPEGKRKKPMSFLQACAFQWVNPKGWVMAVGSIATYAAIAEYPYNAIIIAGAFTLLGLGSSVAWAGLGAVMQKLLHKPKLVRAFNIVMALLLVASLYPIIAESF